MKKLTLPLKNEEITSLKIGDRILLTGYIYTSRDAGHKRMYEGILNSEKLPLDIKDKAIYYVGPCPSKEGEVIGSCGPTTASRMDKYTPLLFDNGLKIVIGKGKRDESVRKTIKKNKGLYLIAIGGTGALISKCVKKSTLIGYEDLLSEALRELYVENFPLIVGIDSYGNDIYEENIKKYEVIEK